MNTKQLILVALPLIAVSLADCGGNSSNGSSGTGSGGSSSSSVSSSSSSSSVSPAGIYTATNTTNGVTVEGAVLVIADGTFIGLSINESNNCAVIESGKVTLNGTSFTGTLGAAVVTTSFGSPISTNCVFNDGKNSTYGTGTLSGTLDPGVSFTDTSAITTSAGVQLPSETGTANLSPLYAEAGSLSKLAGTYADSLGDAMTIDSNGVGFVQDSTSGCVVNSQFMSPDPAHNLYTATATYSGCTGAAAILNGIKATGIFTLDDTVSPSRLIGGATAMVGSQTVAVVTSAAKQ